MTADGVQVTASPERIIVPGIRSMGGLVGLLAVAVGSALAVGAGGLGDWLRVVGALMVVIGALAAFWLVALACRVSVRGDSVVVFGVYRVRRFPREQVAALVVAPGRWPGRGAPYVLPLSRTADYLQVRLTDGTTYRPSAVCTLTSRASQQGSVPSVVDRTNDLLGPDSRRG